MTNPDLLRLVAWSALENPHGSAERVAALDTKVAALTAAQKVGQMGTAFPPDFLLVVVMSLATAWSATSPFFSFQLRPGTTFTPIIFHTTSTNALDSLSWVPLISKAKSSQYIQSGHGPVFVNVPSPKK
jgi:hypothetical protein